MKGTSMKALPGLLIAALFLAVSVAPAQQGTGQRGNMQMRHPGNRGQMMMEKLKLTDQQKSEMKKLHADMQRAMVKSQSAIRLARIDLQQLVTADKLDKAAIEKKVREISNLQQESKSALIDHLFAVYALLTPEQQATFKEHIGQMLQGGMRPGMQMRQGMRMRQQMRQRMGMEPGMGDEMGEDMEQEDE
jgi:Spy/CpxP family protein refolding chaperone